jgi:putative membrane protein
VDESPAPESQFNPPSRRTYFAEERTVLAWWRTGLAATAVALAVGGLLPHLAHLSRTRFVALGAGYGVLALFFVIGGSFRARASHRALEENRFAALPGLVLTIATCYISALVILTIIAFM